MHRIILVTGCLVAQTLAQVSWTPIFVDGNSQVDLWTQEAHGCRCSFDSKRQDCACCAKDGGCPCGRASPHRCTQCGLEDYCANSCNMTIDSRVLSARSGKTFGQIKSPSLEGPDSCHYVLQPLPGQRVELQIYRLVSIGRFNGSGCSGGYLQIHEGMQPTSNPTDIQICGANERYAPPVVVFTDRGPTTLTFTITEPTARSQFLAYFSFTSAIGNQGLQFKGGRRMNQSDCEWLYQDFACRGASSCVLVSPGYPGLYPPRRLCKHHITTSSMHTRVKITFSSILLPKNRCKTDFIAIYQGSSSTSPLLTKICDKNVTEFIYSGPNLLLEFSSGPSVPPYDYNGFRATLEFSEKPTTTESSINFITRTTETGVLSTYLVDGTSAPRVSLPKSNCDMTFSGNNTRSGTFDTRTRSWSPICSFTFIGKKKDIVHISFFNYILKATSCQSSIEVYNGHVEEGMKPTLKLCSPITKHARDPITGHFVEHQHFVSADNELTIVLKRGFPAPFQADTEYLDGAYLFHDEHVDGTLQPSTLCDVDYYGLSSSVHGQVSNPGSQDLYFNIERPLRCAQRFFPAANQSVTLTVASYVTKVPDLHCLTVCGDSGCRCKTSKVPLAETDHLLVQTENGLTLLCLCGEFQEEWLPLTLRSWSPIKLVYSVAQYSWERKGFNFTANYTFATDTTCGHQTMTASTGELETVQITPNPHLNFYYHQHCTWLLDTKVERQLNIELYTAQSRKCTAWNITILEYDEDADDRIGAQLETFCPRDREKKFTLAWKTDLVVIRLLATTQTLPAFTMKWNSLTRIPNTRVSDPQPRPASSSVPTIQPLFLPISLIPILFTIS